MHEPGAGPATILSPNGGHGAASGCADPGHPFAPAGDLSRGGAAGPAAMSAATARWPGWITPPVHRVVAVAAGAVAHAVAASVSRGSRLGVCLAGVCPGLLSAA